MNKFQFSSVVGNFTTIQFLKRDLCTGASGKLLLFHGDVGTGKSSTALIYALTHTCENPTENGPCLECDTCKRNLLAISKGQSSPVLSIINMGMYRKSTDALELINQIFVLQTVGKTVYILEEFHLLPKDVQANFLREIDNMSSELKIILTTSSLSHINEAISSRANKFMFARLNRADARRLIRLYHPGIAYSEEVLEILFEISNYTPRDILVNIEFLLKTGASDTDIRDYLQYISVDDFLELFSALDRGDISTQSMILGELRSRVSMHNLEISLRKFVLNALYCVSGCADSVFTKEQQEVVGKLFTQQYLFKILTELDKTQFTHTYAVDNLFFKLLYYKNRDSLAAVVTDVHKEAQSKSISTQRVASMLEQETEHKFSKLTKQSFKGGV